ncbi:MAG: rRNA biogenesis protein rrp36 [Bathelium mastoideum]|nr:MAG: rRNA biogenesis protein rrp36 [Bathelium mastoideum]
MSLSGRLKKPLAVLPDNIDPDGFSSEADVPSEHEATYSDDSERSFRLREGDDQQKDRDISPSIDSHDFQPDRNIQQQLSDISFAVLAQANESLHRSGGRKRKRVEGNSSDHEKKIQTLRDRLRELGEAKSKDVATPLLQRGSKPNHVTESRQQQQDTLENIDDTSSSTDEATPRKSSRSSKHAPTVQTSKRPVTRNRNVIRDSASRPKPLDPRFSSLTGSMPDESRVRQRYAFLNDYRKAEMDEIREALGRGGKASGKRQRKTGAQTDDETTNLLKKELERMENRERAEAEKERQAKVVREWKREEREKVREGKKPYYLKDSERRKLTLADKFHSMKGVEREKAMRKKRKREGEKEKRNMPAARRMA